MGYTIDPEHKEILDKMFEEGKLIMSIDETENAADLEPIWGNWLFKHTIVEEVGATGLSKTTFNYLLASSLINHKPFLGINGNHALEQIRVLYLDLESSESLIKSRRAMLDLPNSPHFLFCNLPSVTVYELETYIKAYVEQTGPIHIIFIDPLRMAFNTHDENDNSEASKQLKFLRHLTEELDCSIVLVHHSSKAELGGTKKGSGAYARTSLADIVWNFEKLGEGYSSDLFKFYIPKNRYIDDGLCLCIKKEEMSFKLVDFPSNYAHDGNTTKVYSLQQEIGNLFLDGERHDTQELQKKYPGMNRMMLYRVLGALMQLGKIKKVKQGVYVMLQRKM